MTELVVSNAGPLMVLAKLNLLHLLHELYHRVHFPQAVYRETVEDGLRRGYDDARVLQLYLRQLQWAPADVGPLPLSVSSENLDLGEKEAITLAIAQHALLLMDEERGREVARQHGLKVRGSLGVLIEAQRKNLIRNEQLRFYFAEIGARRDIWISPALCCSLLEKLGI